MESMNILFARRITFCFIISLVFIALTLRNTYHFHRLSLLTPEGADRWYVPTHETKFFDFEMVLPADVTCSQCIIQVR